MLAPDLRQSTGTLGESTACDELRRRGYAILATRYRSRFGEIDIVSIRDGVIGFVEVKARRRPAGEGGTSAIDAVHPRKRRRIAAMALDYLAFTRQPDGGYIEADRSELLGISAADATTAIIWP